MKGVKDQQIQLRATASSSRGRKLGRQPVPSSWSWLARVDTSPARLGASCCRPRWQETRWEQPPSVILIIGDQKQAETSLETSIHSYQAPSYRHILSVQDMRMFPAERGDHALVLGPAQPPADCPDNNFKYAGGVNKRDGFDFKISFLFISKMRIATG